MSGYIYIRNHYSYSDYNAYKLGKTYNILERDSQYSTGEIVRGKFIAIYETEDVGCVESLLQDEFIELNIRYDAGIEFYDKKIVELIEPYLTKMNIKYRKLSKDEIKALSRPNRQYIQRSYQNDIIDNSVEYFEHNDKGILVLICGTGKTLISLWIAQKLRSKKIIIGVPNILLLGQWRNVINELFQIPYLLVYSGVDINDIIEFIKQDEGIVITTYSSSYKVCKAIKSAECIFDIKILDEVHHLTSYNSEISDDKRYIHILNIPSIKQLSLTATMKQIENHDAISNDNINYFGSIIDRKSLLWAINKNIVCDYIVQTIISNEAENTDLYMAVYASLKSISDGYSHHVLIYSNNIENSIKIVGYIKAHNNIDGLYYSVYHSGMKSTDQKSILKDFNKSKFGIISCVYCLGEGYDNSRIDAVVFAENMSSNIRIVQSALRACRKNKNEPNKIMKIILPIVSDSLNSDNADLRKVREVIYQMSLEDSAIIEKIKLANVGGYGSADRLNFIEYNELNDILGLCTIKRSELTYLRAKKILADKNIYSKDEYYKLCGKDNRIPINPEETFGDSFKNWIDYLNIERKYYELDECKSKVNEYLLKHNIKKSYINISRIIDNLCEIDSLFPPKDLWVEYYNIKNLYSLIDISNQKKRKGLKQ